MITSRLRVAAKLRGLKILLSGYACNPSEGSESYLGWSMARQIARHHEVWLLTRRNNRRAVEAEMAREPADRLHVVYFDLPLWASFWKKGRRGIHLYYYLWQVGAYWIARRLHRKVGFDLAHHLTFGLDWLPSFLALLPVPFVWGPIVSAQSAGRAFRRTFAWDARVGEWARMWVRRLSRFNPLLSLAVRRTAVGVASTMEARAYLLRLGCRNVQIYPSVGISSWEIDGLPFPHSQKRDGKVRFLCVGRLVAFRVLPLVLRAFAETQLRFPQAELWVIGDGPERKLLLEEVQRLGIRATVKFWGWLSRRETLKRMSECDALLHPCLRGAISMACLEAMAAGLPVVCLDVGGPSIQVTGETGLKLRALSPPQLVRDLATAMLRLAEDPRLRQRLGEAARQRVKDQFTWEARGQRMCEIYCEALAAKKIRLLHEVRWRTAQ